MAGSGTATSDDEPAPDIWAQEEQRQCHLVRPKGWLTDHTFYCNSSKPSAPGSPIGRYGADIMLSGQELDFRNSPA